ncbi:hypothetical protein [Rossellomorea vietnamensis]|uniref:hypothetical protein n=1 Tax=Rossellomorea vietnamensis TaxID=218284 RepID=UPI003D2A75CA
MFGMTVEETQISTTKKNVFWILLVATLLLGCQDQDLTYDNISDQKVLHGKVLE